MDANAILNGLMNATAWIEDVILNGLVARGFEFLKNAFNVYMFFKPFIDLLNALFAMG